MRSKAYALERGCVELTIGSDGLATGQAWEPEITDDNYQDPQPNNLIVTHYYKLGNFQIF